MVAMNEAKGQPEMSTLSVLLNLLWIIFGGLWMAAAWVIAVPAVDKSGFQHRCLHAAALWPESRFTRGLWT